ncbi:restriction endonuclease [Longibaculum muris]|uniref:restriction endonuclease n=1 Tax=Longibaculum muris TaxID=1796628 RepID=UPI00189F9248|nr:restriction endonuclease [Longibaculum muris]
MIPKYNEMYNEVLMVLNQHEEIKLIDLVKEVSNVLNLSEEDRNETLDNDKRTVIYYRLGWTKTYLAKAGLLETVRRGVFKITLEGINVLKSGTQITNEYLMKYKTFVEFVRPNKELIEENTVEENSTPIESIDRSLKMISSRLSDELLEMILSKEPIFFERLVLDLLNKMGYAFDDESVIATKYTGDEGIDGIIKEDRFGFSNIYIQAKRWSGTVGRPEIQKFLGAVAGQGGTKGLFITTSSFTKDAIDFTKKQLQVKLILVDGKMLTKLMMEYNLGVSIENVYEIKRIDMDYFDEEIS